jgi:hypothetical protein
VKRDDPVGITPKSLRLAPLREFIATENASAIILLAATVVAVVTEGTVLSGMNGNPPRVYAVGENFMELPGCHHTVGENNSKEVPAKMVATMVVDTEVIKGGQYQNLVVLDAGALNMAPVIAPVAAVTLCADVRTSRSPRARAAANLKACLKER